MFEDKKITKDKVKDLLYSVRNEFDNELDYDYVSETGFEFDDVTFDIMMEFLDNFLNKVALVIDDELED